MRTFEVIKDIGNWRVGEILKTGTEMLEIEVAGESIVVEDGEFFREVS